MLAVLGGAGNFEGEGEHAASLQRIDDGVHMTARGGEAGIQPALVIGASFLDALLKLLWNGPTFGLQLFKLRAMHRLDGRIAFHHADASSRPSESEVGIEALARHGVVTGAAGVIDG